MSQQYVSLLTSIEIMSESPFCDFEQMAVMMGTYYAMDRMSRMKGEGKQRNPCQGKKCNIRTKKCKNFSAELKSQSFLAGGRGGLIVNTASAAGLVFNQVGNEFNLSICTPALAQTDSIK